MQGAKWGCLKRGWPRMVASLLASLCATPPQKKKRGLKHRHARTTNGRRGEGRLQERNASVHQAMLVGWSEMRLSCKTREQKQPASCSGTFLFQFTVPDANMGQWMVPLPPKFAVSEKIVLLQRLAAAPAAPAAAGTFLSALLPIGQKRRLAVAVGVGVAAEGVIHADDNPQGYESTRAVKQFLGGLWDAKACGQNSKQNTCMTSQGVSLKKVCGHVGTKPQLAHPGHGWKVNPPPNNHGSCQKKSVGRRLSFCVLPPEPTSHFQRDPFMAEGIHVRNPCNCPEAEKRSIPFWKCSLPRPSKACKIAL